MTLEWMAIGFLTVTTFLFYFLWLKTDRDLRGLRALEDARLDKRGG